jgi:hypothetical protein
MYTLPAFGKVTSMIGGKWVSRPGNALWWSRFKAHSLPVSTHLYSFLPSNKF